MLKGNKVFLTAVNKASLDQMREWRNDPQNRKYFREYREIGKEMQEN